MNIILNPIAAVIYLVHLGINIALLFLVIELFLTWKNLTWLMPLAKVGRPITDSMTSAVATGVAGRFSGRKITKRGKLSICIGILTLADLFLAAIVRAVQ